MKGPLVVILAATAAFASAQLPDVRIKLDTTITYLSAYKGRTSLRFYNPLGRFSTVSLTAYLEPGFKAYVSQKLERIANDSDKEQLDEYYVEDPGIWKVGKQYLPFGGSILHESVQAARADTNLIIEGFPIAAAYCDGGPGLQRGVVGRIGSRIGASFAIGRHFGIAGSALDYIRRPEDSPGAGRGWKQAFGTDVSKRTGIVTLRGEVVLLREGETEADQNLQVYDANVTLDPTRYQSLTFGWSRRMPERADFYRFMGSFIVTQNTRLEPMVRYRDDKLYDVSISMRIKF